MKEFFLVTILPTLFSTGGLAQNESFKSIEARKLADRAENKLCSTAAETKVSLL